MAQWTFVKWEYRGAMVIITVQRFTYLQESEHHCGSAFQICTVFVIQTESCNQVFHGPLWHHENSFMYRYIKKVYVSHINALSKHSSLPWSSTPLWSVTVVIKCIHLLRCLPFIALRNNHSWYNFGEQKSLMSN